MSTSSFDTPSTNRLLDLSLEQEQLLKDMLFQLITHLTPEQIGSVEESLVCEWAEDNAEAMCCHESYTPPHGAELLLKLLQKSTTYCPSTEKHYIVRSNIRTFLMLALD